jgi:hypothetical protein
LSYPGITPAGRTVGLPPGYERGSGPWCDDAAGPAGAALAP